MAELRRGNSAWPRRGLALAVLLLFASPAIYAPAALGEEAPILMAKAEKNAEPYAAEEAAAGKRLGPDRAERREALFKALKAAEKETEAQAVEDAIWRFWFIAPNPEADAAMNSALERMRYADYDAALTSFDRLIEMEPEWAEAWNQRALLKFLMNRYDGSLEDILHVLELEPRHFGALSGQAQIMINQGREILAVPTLERAIEIHPFLKERYLLLQLKPKETPT